MSPLRLLVLGLSVLASTAAPAAPPDAWPTVTREARPWAYWWWMASAVDRPNLTRELTRYRDAGMGGVHIIPIYGAKGWESNSIPYLSPRWLEMLDHTVTEAKRLGLGVDLTTGTGWCFGGPHVTDDEANASVVVRTFDIPSGGPLPTELAAGNPQAVVAFNPDGHSVDLLAEWRRTGTTPPALRAELGPRRLYVVTQKPSGQRVKRAAPGGQGHMLNLFSGRAMSHYLAGFSAAFDGYRGARPRAMYHDSYEYNSNWAPDLLAQFAARRGYRLETEFPALFDRNYPDPDRAARVRTDYRETLSDVMIDTTVAEWVRWSHRHGFLTRNEAHGSPGELLDLYALADIPETEMFNKDRSRLVSRLASSAAHVAGRRLVASETGTWLKEHFTETLADMKWLLDDLYLSGVNHVFYHGTCYSPDEAPWPGWLFYASFEMNPRNSVWHDVPALNAYAARCQSVLQSDKPDNELLLYWPVHDVWHSPSGMEQRFTVHNRDWIEPRPVGLAAHRLEERGFAFDFISDRQLLATRVRGGRLRTAGAEFRIVAVPRCEYLPDATFDQLLRLGRDGATVIFENAIPTDVPGWANLAARRANRTRRLAELPAGTISEGVREIPLGRGRLLVGGLEPALALTEVRRESLVDHPGLGYVRRRFEGGRHYFVANRGLQRFEGELPIAFPARSVVVLDPLSGAAESVAVTASTEPATGARLRLRLEPGESVILRAFAKPVRTRGTTGTVPQTRIASTARSIILNGRWQVDFVGGGPELPTPISSARLASWTELGDDNARRFAGTARYTTTFDAPGGNGAGPWFIDLGVVRQSARVRLNGRDLGAAITPPFRVIADRLEATGNRLEVEVTSVAANRIRDLDRRGVSWRTFHDINFVNLDYKPFDASNWPLTEAGLSGPVSLQPCEPLGPPARP